MSCDKRHSELCECGCEGCRYNICEEKGMNIEQRKALLKMVEDVLKFWKEHPPKPKFVGCEEIDKEIIKAFKPKSELCVDGCEGCRYYPKSKREEYLKDLVKIAEECICGKYDKKPKSECCESFTKLTLPIKPKKIEKLNLVVGGMYNNDARDIISQADMQITDKLNAVIDHLNKEKV